LLNSSPEVDVVGTARDGVEALEVITRTKPDVICTDLLMEKMDGLELTKRVMAEDPRPILVISTFVQKNDVDNVFRLLQAGASDVFPKPSTDSPTDYERLKSALIAKIKVLSNMKVTAKRPGQSLSGFGKPMTSGGVSGNQPLISNVSSRVKAITIGASSGGLQSIQKILCQLPSNFPLPIICTVHVTTGILPGMVNWLSSECGLQVKIAQVGESPVPGTVYFAPEKNNLEIDVKGRFVYSECPATDKNCPSINATFKSVARYYGRATAGVLLSGIGRDGAEGLQVISQVGGITVGQDDRGGAFGMVKEAMGLNAVQQVLGVDKIAAFLLKTISG
jgi:two-component system chemotaxis response regulator CheB